MIEHYQLAERACNSPYRTLVLYLTLFCKSTSAPADSSTDIVSLLPLKPAHMSAVQPSWPQ